MALFQQVRTIVGKQTNGEDTMLRHRFTAAMDIDMNTPEALLLLKQAAETVVVNNDTNTGAETLKLAKVLGLRIAG